MSDFRDRVESLLPQEPSAKALRERVLTMLRTRLAFDAHVFALVDPVTLVATSPHADVPILPWDMLPETILWRYQTPVTRIDRLLEAPALSLRGATTDPSESAMWHHVQRDLGVVDTASVAFADRYGAWGFLELWRTTTPFTPADLELLTELRNVITRGLRAALLRTFSTPAPERAPLGPAVLLLGTDLRVRDQTEAAAQTLLQLLPPDEPMPPIPAAAYNVGAALLAAEAGMPLGEPWSRVNLGGSRWVTVKASRLGADLAVSIEPVTPTERTDLYGRAAGLSDREREVLSLLVNGVDTHELADMLVVSEHTASDHVKAVLAKTGARTRQVLLARALGES